MTEPRFVDGTDTRSVDEVTGAIGELADFIEDVLERGDNDLMYLAEHIVKRLDAIRRNEPAPDPGRDGIYL